MNQSPQVRNIILIATVIFVLLTIAKSFYLTGKYGGVDLRTRIVGTRAMMKGESPYFYKWKSADGEFYLDPIDVAGRKVNGNVVTPATMYLLYPLSLLRYTTAWWLWTGLQLLAGFAIIFLLFRSGSIPATIVQSSLVILGLICSEYWFYNIESGQIYVFYTLLFAGMYRCYTSRWRYHEFMSGFIGGLFILFRPFAAVVGLGFLLHGKLNWIKGAFAGVLAGCLLFVLPNPPLWLDYFTAMKEYVNENMGLSSINLQAIEPLKPAVIEGADNLRNYMVFDLGRMNTVYFQLERFGIQLSYNQCLILYAIILAPLSYLFIKLKKIAAPYQLFLFGFLLYILAELFIPAPRQAYNIIQWLFPLSLLLIHRGKQLPLLIMMITALLFLHKFPFGFSQQGMLTELIFLVLLSYATFSKKLQTHGSAPNL